jgi:hypothetical protein
MKEENNRLAYWSVIFLIVPNIYRNIISLENLIVYIVKIYLISKKEYPFKS